MPSSNPSRRRQRLLRLLLIATLVVAARAPFLLRGDRLFNADEAVEGLMARHVLLGERPMFFWGQRYKGVPEVYLTAAAFALTGPSVIVLKGVTLGCFAAFVVAQFVLVARLFSRAIAWIATAFLVLGPPSLVLWSVSANAEIVLTLLAGTVLCLGFDIWRRTGSRLALGAAGLALGCGLWVQQFIAYYVIALAVAVLYDLPRRRAIVREVLRARDMPRGVRAGLYGLVAAALTVVALGGFAFVAGGFDVTLHGLRIGMHHPQKLWRVAAGLLILWGGARSISLLMHPRARSIRANVLVGAAAFAVGYAPALIGRVAAGGYGMPIARADLRDVATALPSVIRQVVPIVLGFRSPDTVWLEAPWWLGLPIVLAIGASCTGLRRRAWTPLFHVLIVVAPLLFLLSGSFIDAQSYRYLMPAAGALAVVMAIGVSNLFNRSRLAGTATLTLLLALFLFEQAAWYRQLTPDTGSAVLISCLDRANVRAAYADYWLSYKLTFLTGERIIVAPNSGVDRYPPYTAYVRTQPAAPTISLASGTTCADELSPGR